jgi:hypothetical protein
VVVVVVFGEVYTARGFSASGYEETNENPDIRYMCEIGQNGNGKLGLTKALVMDVCIVL